MISAKSEVQVDTPEVRVTEWRLAPGSATGHHIHEMDYVIVPVTSGEMTIVAPGGERSKAQLGVGKSYFRKAGVEHDVLNETDDRNRVPGGRAEAIANARLPICHRSVAVDPLMRLKVPASNATRGVAGHAEKVPYQIYVDILPSVAATVIGAYIVNHYIVTKPAADAPVAAADVGRQPQDRACARQGRRCHRPPMSAIFPRPGSRRRGSPKRPSWRNRRPKSRKRNLRINRAGNPQRSPPTSRRRPPAFPPTPAVTSPRRAKRRSPRPLRRRCSLLLPLSRRSLPPRPIPPRQLRPPARRKIAATPTILPARRSSACAAPTRARRARRKPPVFRRSRIRRCSHPGGATCGVGAGDPAAAAADHGFDARARNVRFVAGII